MELLKSAKFAIAGVLIVAGITATSVFTIMGIDTMLSQQTPKDPFFTLKDKPPFRVKEMGTGPTVTDLHPLIALYRKNLSGEWIFHCSAMVVTNSYALTASHCLRDESGELTTEEIQVRTAELSLKNSLIVKAASMNPRADLGIVLGDFSQFQKALVARRGFWNHDGPYVNCGFPYGETPPVCIPFVPVTNHFFMIKGAGQLYPGMSGGPVIDTTMNEVVGLNLLADDGFVAVAPMIGFLGALQLELEN